MANGVVTDERGRGLRDLRISLTDRCNMRCTYCMPKEIFGPDFAYLPRSEILSFEEIEMLVQAFANVGVAKIRLTGGEPLLRRDLPCLIEKIVRVSGIEDVALTTNGILLPRLARSLKDAGLSRVTVSLDSLRDEVFQKINDRGFRVEQVLAGIEAAREAGLEIKINTVVERGINDEEVVDIARFFKDKKMIVRFIEFMDVGNVNAWSMDKVMPSAEIVARIHERMPLVATEPNYRGEVARRYRYADDEGEVGFISSITQPFCGDCHRARLSAKGELYTCLFATMGLSLRDPLRAGKTVAELSETIFKLWGRRSDRYSEERAGQRKELVSTGKVEMSYIGG